MDLGENIGMEFSGKHPAVVLRDAKPNIDQIFCLPLTTKKPNSFSPNRQGIFLEINRIQGLKGYQHPSNPNNVNNWKHWCNILNIRNISKRRIFSPPTPCRMDGGDLTAISSAIKNQIAI